MQRCFFAVVAAVILTFFSVVGCDAQTSGYITGKITDAKTGEPLPYVTVFIKTTARARIAISTDFSGLYKLAIPANLKPDSIFSTYISYVGGKKKLLAGQREVDFQLQPDVKMLKDVVVTPHTYVNPAWEIMQNVILHKDSNNFERLHSYSFESYKRIDLAINNISESMKRRKFMRQITPIMDSLKKAAGSEGTPILPVFMSESISDMYITHKPQQKAEKIISTRSKGIGIEDQTLISQIVSAGFQQYNFYRNYVRLAGKDFVSPITDAWKLLYNFELVERYEKINGVEYYRINFEPKRSHDLAFKGVMWITHDTYALYRVDLSVSPDANLDFFKKIRIQQEMIQTPGTQAWIPEKTRVVVEVSNLLKNQPGFIGKFYIANKKIEVNKVYPKELFRESLTMAPNMLKGNDDYWNKNRYDTLSAVDKRTYQVIDTVRNLPIVRTYADIAATLINGYYRIGKISLGPYFYTYSRNDLQGSVARIGGITNKYFSNKLVLGGFISYAFQNQKINYGGNADYIISRKPWTEAGVSYSHDIAQTGYQFENFSRMNGIFNASIRNGNLIRRGPFQQNDLMTYIQRDIEPDVRAKITLQHRTFDPLFAFNYTRRDNREVIHNYQVAEGIAELQWTPGRKQLQSDQLNKRILINDGEDNPVVTVRYTHGAKVIGGDFDYNKIAGNITQKVHMGLFGKGEYSFTAGYIPSTLPFPLLENHRFNFNTMRFLEFTSDKWVSLNYTQHMEGFLTNSIPLLKSLDLRTVADFNVLEGSISDANNTLAGRSGIRLYDRSLKGIPYVEVGYGVENILKFLRFDVLYRVNHNEHLDENGLLPSPIALKVSIQFRL